MVEHWSNIGRVGLWPRGPASPAGVRDLTGECLAPSCPQPCPRQKTFVLNAKRASQNRRPAKIHPDIKIPFFFRAPALPPALPPEYKSGESLLLAIHAPVDFHRKSTGEVCRWISVGNPQCFVTYWHPPQSTRPRCASLQVDWERGKRRLGTGETSTGNFCHRPAGRPVGRPDLTQT